MVWSCFLFEIVKSHLTISVDCFCVNELIALMLMLCLHVTHYQHLAPIETMQTSEDSASMAASDSLAMYKKERRHTSSIGLVI